MARGAVGAPDRPRWSVRPVRRPHAGSAGRGDDTLRPATRPTGTVECLGRDATVAWNPATGVDCLDASRPYLPVQLTAGGTISRRAVTDARPHDVPGGYPLPVVQPRIVGERVRSATGVGPQSGPEERLA
ncbi:hypothetical protein Sar04_28390 [Salinispora arenicola]|uniref:Uncharacterized protein n=1 Tax=Salinispora arenicola TaxID=168697 RepID=A0ABQ4JT17_SALAC|nr:hypothetical protein Sar04_28390 [Salinispora arenicola]